MATAKKATARKTTKKRTAKKPPRKSGKLTISDVDYPNIDTLKPYHKNPRIGDVDKVADSLIENGMFKPIVVNRGTGTGRKNEILAGNHTWLAARSLGWETIAVVYVDVDDEASARIVLADNRTSDVGEYDDALLADLLQDLPTLEGTGYSDIDLGELLTVIPDVEVVDVFGTVQKRAVVPTNPVDLKKEEGLIDAEDVDEDDEAPEPTRPSAVSVKEPDPETVESTSIDAQPENLPGLIQVADPNVRFEIEQTPYDIPRLIPGLIPVLPDRIDCWAGPAIAEDDGEKWWLYNYSSDSTKGLPWDRTFLGFYVFEDRYENWWARPDKQVSRMLNVGCHHAIMPDFSVIHDNPRVEQMYQVYRNHWLARFMQECGVSVVPNFTPPPTTADLEWAIAGIPDNPASLSIQLQTVVAGKGSDKGQVKRTLGVIKEGLKLIAPESLLVYASEAGETALDVLRPECRVVVVPTRRRRWQQSKGDWLKEKMEEEREAARGKDKSIKRRKAEADTGDEREADVAEKRARKRTANKRLKR